MEEDTGAVVEGVDPTEVASSEGPLDTILSFFEEQAVTILTDVSSWLVILVLGAFATAGYRVFRSKTLKEPESSAKHETRENTSVLEDYVSFAFRRSLYLSFGDTQIPQSVNPGDDLSPITLDKIWTPLRAAESTARSLKTGTHENLVEDGSGTPVNEILFTGKRDIILLGEPGSGKSTTMAATTNHLCQAWDENQKTIPIWIKLSDVTSFHNGDELETLISGCPELELVEKKHGKNAANNLKADLKSNIRGGAAVLLLDGLDEVKDVYLRDLISVVGTVVSRHKTARVIVSCRTFDYMQSKPVRKLPIEDEVELLPFEFEEQQLYVEKWYSASVSLGRFTQAKADELRSTLLSSLKNDENVADLARSPMLLALLTLIHSNEARLPDTRAVLCDRAVSYMLADSPMWRDRQAESATIAASPEITLAVEIAYRLHKLESEDTKDQKIAGISSREIAEAAGGICKKVTAADTTLSTIDPTEIANKIMRSHGLLKLVHDDVYQFAHRSFQEYLAGQYFSAGAHHIEALQCASSIHWVEPFRLMASLAGHERNNLFYVLKLSEELIKTPNEMEDSIHRLQLGAEMLIEIGVSRLALHQFQYIFEKPDEQEEPTLWRRAQDAMKKITETSDATLADRHRSAVALGTFGDERIVTENGELLLFKNLIPLPAANYSLGSSGDEGVDFKTNNIQVGTSREVNLDEFSIGKYLVTNVEFSNFIDDGGYTNKAFWPGKFALGWLEGSHEVLQELKKHWLDTLHHHHQKELDDGEISLENVEREADERIAPRQKPFYWNERRFNGPNQPVVGVNFWEARAFCFWATDLGRRTNSIATDQIIRLPTEVEWEATARSYFKTKSYPWGNEWNDNRAHVRTNSLNLRSTSPVGVYPAAWRDSPMDIAGNVWEWTESLFLPFDAKFDPQRMDVDSLEERSVRGSSWYNNPSYTACSARGMDRSYNLFYDVGFRVVKSGATRTTGEPS